MDAIDRKILSELQQEARLTVTALADRVQVSLSAGHRRLRELERSGVIVDYRAKVDPAMVGLGFRAVLFVTMRDGGSRVLDEFETAVIAVPEVIDAQRLFGEPDYVLRVVTQDLASYQRLYDTRLSALPGVLRLSSTLVMKEVIRDRPLPLI
ncbi:Lrp/AsnC family transcriptional regulator [Curtobacterium sp. 18060]|uniref:Lrp/AsnC family transcriptional regulator n=1 Tax=Curtobacterium sp. 18060 TaxID=2681408 RepID=UPI0013575952|nr:Lrp/AsnC family transcriptional regulator [Curtobacterium sp. 18060]